MCWAMFGCCNNLYTVKAFDSATLEREWRKLKVTTGTSNDFAISLWNDDILVYGEAVDGVTEGVLVTRDPETGAPNVYSESDPLAFNESGNAQFSEDSNATDGAWLVHGDAASYWDPAVLDDPIIQGAEVTLDVNAANRHKLFYQSGTSVISGKDATTIAKWDADGTETASLATSALSLTSGYSLSGSAFAIENRNGTPILFYGRETNGASTLRRIWQVNTSLTETAALTGGTHNDFTYQNTDSILHKPWTPDGNYAFLRTGAGIQRIDLGALGFGWHNTDDTIDRILCADNSLVYVIAIVGLTRRLRAIDISTGVTAWTTGSLGAAGDRRARVTSAGLALWLGSNPVRIYDVADGTLLESIDNDGTFIAGIQDVAEYDGRIYVAGGQRS